MTALNGYVKIHRRLIQWGWYKNSTVKNTFLHLIFIANFKDMMWQDVIIKRGQVVTSYKNLAADTGMTVQQVRNAISKLKSTGEITSKSTNKYTVITLVNYEDYQCANETPTDKTTSNTTNEQQTSNKQTTNKQQQRKNDKNVKNDKNIKKTIQKKDFNSLISDFTNNTEVEKAILDFIEMRTAIKKPLTTSRALNGLLNKLKPHSDTDKIKLLDEAIEKNWLSVYPRENERSIKQLD